MVGICGLAPNTNQYPNYNADTRSCAANNHVREFFKEPGENKEKTEYKRKSRWYEKYYKR